MRFLVFLSLLAYVAAQGNLNDFDEVTRALSRGAELTMNADSEQCQVDNFEFPLLVTMPMRNWQIIVPTTGPREIRADDWYVGTGDVNALSFILRTVSIFDNDDVVITLSSTAPNMTAITLNCRLGDGAQIHRWVDGGDLENVNNYQAVKGTLLFGDHVDAVGTLNDCAGSEVFEGTEYTVGFMINRFQIVGDGTPEEALYIFDAAIVAADEENGIVVSAEVLVLRPDNSAELVIGILDGAMNQINNITLQCGIGRGDGITFTQNERERDTQLVAYADIKDATLSGHDMEIVSFLDFCTFIEGETFDVAGQIGSLRFDEFQFFEANQLWGDVEFIGFSSFNLDVNGGVAYDIVRVFEDGNVEIEYHMLAPGSGGELFRGKLSCPLETATVFHSVSRSRAPESNYNEIIQRIRERGQIFEIEIAYERCDTGDQALGSIFGGIAWETYIDPAPDTGYFFANMFALVTQNITGTPGPAYDASGIALLPDGTVYVDVRLYDYFTGENLIADLATEPIVCELANGPSGSVYFYRYPN